METVKVKENIDISTTTEPDAEQNRQAWNKLLAKIQQSSTQRERFIKQPEQVLQEAGIQLPDDKPFKVLDGNEANYFILPPVEAEELVAPKVRQVGDSGVIKLHAYWYGPALELSEDRLKQLMGMATIAQAAAVLAAAIGGPSAKIIGGVFAAYILAEKGAIMLVDKGNGVYLNITWPQIWSGLWWLIIPSPR